MNVRLAVKAAVMGVVVDVLVYIPAYMLVMRGEATTFGAYYGDVYYMLNAVILGLCGYWLGREATGVAPCDQASVWRQFLRQYGLLLVVMLLVLYIISTDFYWPFRDVAVWYVIDGVRTYIPTGGMVKMFVWHVLSLGSMCGYLVLYLSYGWAKCWRQVRLGLNEADALRFDPVWCCCMPVLAIVTAFLFAY